ncbi:MAG TPA: ABC transporter ATP-binding protein, partial [Chloroflexota bacterium]
MSVMVRGFVERNDWKLATVLPRADAALAAIWWSILLLRGVLPAVFAIAMGRLVSAVQAGGDLVTPLTLVGVVFVLLQ